jgi:8-oxo-dGTP pyrophosphatase MutT (NUDIX family)
MSPTDLSQLAEQLEHLSQLSVEFDPSVTLLDLFKRNDPRFDERIPAAVCVLFQGPSVLESRVLLTLRSNQVATHAGQVAFPGGSLDPADDSDFVRAALRECHEEVGIRPEWICPHGAWSEFPTLGGHFTVRPVLASLSQPVHELSLQADEVVAAEWVSVRSLLQSQEFEERSIFGHVVKAPVFWWGSHRMWGLSAWIFHSIVLRYANLKS